MTTSSAIFRLLATGVMLPLITSFPVLPNYTWTDPCNGLGGTPPSTVPMLELMQLLTEDAQGVQKGAEELMNFYTTVQKDEYEPRVTALYLKKLEGKKLANFSSDKAYDKGDILTLVLLNDYRQMSRVAILCQAAKTNDETHSPTTKAQSPLSSLTDIVTIMLCHLDVTLRKTGFTVTAFDENDEVLGDYFKADPQHRVYYDYVIFRDIEKFASALHQKYSDISNGMSSDKPLEN